MCGICGILGYGKGSRFGRDLLGRMCGVMTHRGPDDEGFFDAEFAAASGPGRIGLGHRRLSIIDIGGGHQPLTNEDGSLQLVFNGEIYNFEDLRAQLRNQGHTFQTRTDSEVILHHYEERGVDCLEDFRGMFAFALWDARRNRLFLARDRLGQKPLSYFWDGERFIFGSEVKAILEAPSVPRQVDPRALDLYLTLQYVPHPFCMFRGIRKLSPAHYLLVDESGPREEEYWRPQFRRTKRRRAADYAAELRELLTEATRYRLISDVPLGAFLSGGIDSTLVVGIMSRICKEPVRTFSIGFEEKRYDELDYARLAARHFGTEHQEFIVRPRAMEVIPKLVWHYDEPFADSSAIPTWYVSQVTRRHVTVALTGDAGDECFAGYPRYRAVRLAGAFDLLPGFLRRFVAGNIGSKVKPSIEIRTFRRRLRRFLEALALPPEARYLRWCCIFDDERREALYSDDFADQLLSPTALDLFHAEYEKCGADIDFVGRTTFVDLMRYLPDDLLVKVDIASMAHGLETRSPFLDHHVIEFIATLPTDLKLRGLTAKYLLKYAFRDILPPAIARRRKMGFGVPIADWFRGELKDYVRDVLLDARTVGRGYFRREPVEALIDEHAAGRFDHGYRLWSLLMLELWHREFMDP